MKITTETHLALIKNTLDSLSKLLVIKGKEYVRNDDPLHNFNVGGIIAKEHPAKTLDGFLMKHYVSYRDMLEDLEKGITPTEDKIHEKFNDILVYFLIQKNIFLQSIEPNLTEHLK